MKFSMDKIFLGVTVSMMFFSTPYVAAVIRCIVSSKGSSSDHRRILGMLRFCTLLVFMNLTISLGAYALASFIYVSEKRMMEKSKVLKLKCDEEVHVQRR